MKSLKIVLLSSSFLFLSCGKDIQVEEASLSSIATKATTRSETVEDFDWETVDYMPYPTNIIPVPWIGQGSLSYDYDMDVVNDHRKDDGWKLVYSTFKSSSYTNNPYFILYNEYRGLMRIYVYVTNQSVVSSTNTHNFVKINSNYQTSMLNFMGTTLVDGSRRGNVYDEIVQNPTGYGVYAPNKWYMAQFEFAYDPNIESMAYDDINLGFDMKYLNTQNIELNGEQIGTIKGSISSSGGNFLSQLQGAVTTAIQGSYGFIGKYGLDKYKDDSSSNGNSLGIEPASWTALVNGATNLITGGTSGTLQSAANILCGTIFGYGGSTQTVNLQFDSSITMNGTITQGGQFPSMPVSMRMPGTAIPSTAQGQFPLYNKSFGVFNVLQVPNILMRENARHYKSWDDFKHSGSYVTETITTLEIGQNSDFGTFVTVNPAVLDIATVDISYDIIGKTGTNNYEINPSYYAYESDIAGSQNTPIPKVEMMIRYRIKVTPKKSNVPPSVIYKTFKLKPVIIHHDYYYENDANSQKEKEALIEKVKAQLQEDI